jgi:hypothetical protein
MERGTTPPLLPLPIAFLLFTFSFPYPICSLLYALCVFTPCAQPPAFWPYCVWHATQWLSSTGRQTGEVFLQTSRTLSQRG